MDQLTTLSDHPNSGNNGGNDMVTALTSTMDGDEAPSTMDGDEAPSTMDGDEAPSTMNENLLNAPRNLFTATMVAEEEEEPFPTTSS